MASIISDLPISKNTRLAVDAGGSTLRIMECNLEGETLTREVIRSPQTRYSSLEEGLTDFILRLGHRPSHGAIGIAGPTDTLGRIQLSNLEQWPPFDTQTFASTSGIVLQAVNDLVAAAACLESLGPNDLATIRPGSTHIGPKLVVTFSTGLNDALAIPGPEGPTLFAGESGHAAFAPRDDAELDLLSWLHEKGDDFVSFEDVISGDRGWKTLFEFVVTREQIKPLATTLETLASGAPSGPTITNAALEQNDPAASRAVVLAGGIMGSYLDVRLASTLPSGGIFLVGSVSQHEKLMERIVHESALLDRLNHASPVQKIADEIGIHRVIHPDFGLVGAANLAARMK